MKKIMTTSIAAATLLVTSAQADFDFGEMFQDMKEAAMTLTKDSQDKPAQASTDTKATEEKSKNS